MDKLKILKDNYLIPTGKSLNKMYQTDRFSENGLFISSDSFTWLQRNLYGKFDIIIQAIEDHFMPDDRIYTEFMIIY